MQLTHPVRVVNGSATVELLHGLTLSGVTGTYTVGHTVALTAGAAGVIVDVAGALVTVAITSATQPQLADVVTSSGGATGTLAAFDTQPDLAGAGVDGGELFVRDGDAVAYTISATPSNCQLQLSAPYGGASSSGAAALGRIHSTRTPNVGLPTFDRRDRELQVVLAEAMRQLDALLQDHEDRIAALEP